MKFFPPQRDRVETVLGCSAIDEGARSRSHAGVPIPVSTRTRVRLSNGAFRSRVPGSGRPDIACVIERLVDRAAAEHGFRPESRCGGRISFHPEAMPYKTANGTTTTAASSKKVMDKALLLADWKGFPAGASARSAKGSCAASASRLSSRRAAAGVAPKDQAFARFDASGICT